MKAWQWMVATLISGLVMLGGWFTIANGMIDSKIQAKLEAPNSLIQRVFARLDQIENKLDRLIERNR